MEPQIPQILADLGPASAGRTASVMEPQIPQILADLGPATAGRTASVFYHKAHKEPQ